MKRILIFIGLKLWELLKVIFYIVVVCAGLLIVCQLIYMLGSLLIFLWSLIPWTDSYHGSLWWMWKGNSSLPGSVGITFIVAAGIIVLIIIFWKDIASNIYKFFKSNWDKAGQIANKKGGKR